MPVNLGLLSDASISGLPEETKNQLQNQATMQMIWGALLGDPAMGFKSAQDIPTRYIATQSHLQDLQTKQKQLAEIESWKSKYTPSQIQAMTSAEGMVSPDIFGEGPQRRPQDVVGPPTENVYNAQRIVAQNIANRPIDQTKAIRDLLNISGNPAAPNMLANLQALQGKTQGNFMIDPNGNITSVLPQINKEGTAITATVEGGVPKFTMSPIAGSRQAIESTTPTEVPVGAVIIGHTPAGVPIIRNAEGLVEVLQSQSYAKQLGTIVATPTETIDITGRKTETWRTPPPVNPFVPKPAVAPAPITSGQLPLNYNPNLETTNTPKVFTPRVQPPVNEIVKALPASQEAMLKSGANRWDEFTKASAEASMTASDRKLAADRLYNLADSIDGNKFSNIKSESAAYLRSLPFVGNRFDELTGNTKLMNVEHSKYVLNGLNSIKGNANGFEGAVVRDAAPSLTDPKIATKFIAALDIASADKDVARQQFIEGYAQKGLDVNQAQTNWANSPDNPRIYNHPKVNQFLMDQIRANPAKPVFPAGFELVQNRTSKDYFVRKPDNSLMPIR